MPVTRTRRKATRREELIDAAVRQFSAHGVRATSVDGIVHEAGVAKGTFYLYFASRDDIVLAVAERLVERIGGRMAAAVGDCGLPAADRIRGISAAMASVTADPFEAELMELIHRPENQPIHDGLGAAIAARLAPTIAGVIADGIRDGVFGAQDPEHAAAFVLATYGALDALVTDPAQLAAVTGELDAFVLRGLGYRGGAA